MRVSLHLDFTACLDRHQVTVDLPADTNAADLARYVATVIHGMAVQAATAANHAQLRRVIHTAMRVWPD
jgi:hypothetical protein